MHCFFIKSLNTEIPINKSILNCKVVTYILNCLSKERIFSKIKDLLFVQPLTPETAKTNTTDQHNS